MIKENKPINTLDCTLRDGGYYNNWDFDRKLVDNYLHALTKSKVDYVEIGFRNLSSSIFMGPYAYSRDRFLEKLNISKDLKLGVMIDTKEVLSSENGIKKTIDTLLSEKSQSNINLIRFATHFSDVNSLGKIVKLTKDKGYKIAINLMQTGGKSEEQINRATKYLAQLKEIDVLYFADSLGNMREEDIIKTISLLRNNWHKDLGIHAHNNKGLALSNTLVALNNGVNWVDSTVRGMGRGAGNAETEILLSELNRIYRENYRLDEIYKLAVDDFKILNSEFNWGQSLLYSLAADNNIHPTYIQEMISDSRYNDQRILEAINFMKNIPSASFNKEFLDNFVKNQSKNNYIGNWNASNWCKSKEVLIVGSGPSIKRHHEGIIEYIKEYKPTVLSLNINNNIEQKFIDGYVIAKKSRTVMDSVFYKNLKKPLFASKNIVSDNPDFPKIKKRLKDYGMNFGFKKFRIEKNSCYLPNDLAISYALALATIGNAKKISLVGFDGYKQNNSLQEEMIETIKLYKNNKKNINIYSLTPTSYPVDSDSLYAPRKN